MEVFLALGDDDKYLADVQATGSRPASTGLVPATCPPGSTSTTADQPQ